MLKRVYQCFAMVSLFIALAAPAFGQNLNNTRWNTTFNTSQGSGSVVIQIYSMTQPLQDGYNAYTINEYGVVDGGLQISPNVQLDSSGRVKHFTGTWYRQRSGTFDFYVSYDQYGRPYQFSGTYTDPSVPRTPGMPTPVYTWSGVAF